MAFNAFTQYLLSPYLSQVLSEVLKVGMPTTMFLLPRNWHLGRGVEFVGEAGLEVHI